MEMSVNIIIGFQRQYVSADLCNAGRGRSDLLCIVCVVLQDTNKLAVNSTALVATSRHPHLTTPTNRHSNCSDNNI